MKSFWTSEHFDSGRGVADDLVDIGAGDEFGAQFAGVFDKPVPGAKQLTGYLQFPQRTQESTFRGSLAALKKLCRQCPSAYGVIHDPRWDHRT